MKTQINISFNYGGSILVFRKSFNLPFTPFLGLEIIFNDEKEYTVKFVSNDYCSTIIRYNLEKNQFEVDVRNVWRWSISDDTVNYTLDMFSDWERMDSTNISDLKELINSPRIF